MKHTIVAFAFTTLCLCSVGQEQPAAVETAGSAGIPVRKFQLKYGAAYPKAPALEQLERVPVGLGVTGNTFTDVTSGETKTIKVGQDFGDARFSPGAVKAVENNLVHALNESGYYGVFVTPPREEIDPQSGADLRAPENRDLTLVVWISEVGDVRTVAKSEDFKGDRINNKRHHRIAENSPLKAGAGDKPGSLFEKLQLDDYLRRLNRHPGRRVDAALSSSEQPGKVVLDYLVNENRPWFIYGQVSNTGTEATSVLRERIGIVHNQVFGRDDIASLDYITSNISKANAVFGSYSFPIFFPDKLRVRGYGSWGDFNATTPLAAIPTGGVAVPPEQFTGNSYLMGLEATASPWSFRGIAIDFTVGAAIQHVEVNNKTLLLQGSADLLTPYASVRIERENEFYSYSASIGYETNTKDTPTTDLVRLGRLDTNSSYDLLRAEISASAFLEALFRKGGAPATLAHELAFGFKSQYALGDNRLIPQKEQAIGGFFSVRGYPESVVAGDKAYTFSAEYRFHYPRSLKPATESDTSENMAKREDRSQLFGRPFQYRPPRPYARPDWDLIFRGFVDGGSTQISTGTQARRPEDRDQSLLGAGLGFEVQVFRNFNFRADAGWALKGIKTGIDSSTGYIPGSNDVSQGSIHGHFLLTVVW